MIDGLFGVIEEIKNSAVGGAVSVKPVGVGVSSLSYLVFTNS